jgi:hypothetical protein
VYRAIVDAVEGVAEGARTDEDLYQNFWERFSRTTHISEASRDILIPTLTATVESININGEQDTNGPLKVLKVESTMMQIPIVYADSYLHHNGGFINLTGFVKQHGLWEIGYEKLEPLAFGDLKCKMPVVSLDTKDVKYDGTLAVHELGWVFDCVKTGPLRFTVSEFARTVKVSNRVFGFHTENAELWLTVPSNPNTVAMWQFESAESGPVSVARRTAWEQYY